MAVRLVECPSCGRKARFDDAPYRNMRVHIQCRKCQATWWVEVPVGGDTTSPTPAAETAPATAPAPDEDPRHQEARRLARFIVQEIRLYHQAAIERANTRDEVLQAVKRDLELGRKHYLSRIDPALREGPDYFTEAVEEILLTDKK